MVLDSDLENRVDFISKMTDPILELILQGLPTTKEVVRTSYAQRSFDVALRSALERIVTASGPGFGDCLLACRLSFFDLLMALSKSQAEDYTSDWLRVVPISGLGHTMNGRTYRCVLCYRLGVSFFQFRSLVQLVSGFLLGIFMETMMYRVLVLLVLNVIIMLCTIPLVDICYRLGISAGKEVDIGLDRGCDKPLRPTDMLLYSWDGRLDVYVWI
ncbi:hypothetical protein Tco_1007900 [Tanacetum coccineum]